MRPTEEMLTYRKKFLFLVTATCINLTLQPEEISDFYNTGFLPAEWLNDLFCHIKTEQYDIVAECVEHMYPKIASFKPSKKPTISDFEEDVWDMIHKESHTDNKTLGDHDLIDKCSTDSPVEVQPVTTLIQEPEDKDTQTPLLLANIATKNASPTTVKRNRYSYKKVSRPTETTPSSTRFETLESIVQKIFLSACKKALHPSGCHIDFVRLQSHLTNILPDHTIMIDAPTHMITVLDENGATVLHQKTPTEFPCAI